MALTVPAADIGGTSTRIARAGADGRPFDLRWKPMMVYDSLEDLFAAYFEATAAAGRSWACSRWPVPWMATRCA